MDAIHKGGIVAHFWWKRSEQVANPLLMLHIYFEIAHQDDATFGADTLTATRKFPRLHEAFHDVYTILLDEVHPRNFVKANHIVLADQAALAARHVDEHARHGRLATGDEMSVGRDLLEQVTLAGAAWPEFDHVIVALDKGNHTQQHRVSCPRR